MSQELQFWLEQQFNMSRSYLTGLTGGSQKSEHKWTTLEHNGVEFPPNYIYNKIPLIYDGQEVIINKEAEEAALLYAKYINSDYAKMSVFNKNFWHDFKKLLHNNMTEFNKCDFKNYVEFLRAKKENKANNKENKENNKSEDKYKTAIVDGKPQTVGNYRMEPPGIFLGRGKNPNIGKIKKRIEPEDITINIGKDAKIPELENGRKWHKIIHDRTAIWLASWKDTITSKTKYVWLGAQSDLKAASDMQKFDIARKLKKKIKKIRLANEENLLSDDIKTKQVATALYFVDRLALRVGNEKGEDEADTVGVTSLRVEHIELVVPNTIKLDFLGKDSVRYTNSVVVTEDIFNNIKLFIEGKAKDDQIFDKISSSDLNKYLQTFMDGLTAKVFRTYNASNLFQKELNKITEKYKDDPNVHSKILFDLYNKANGKVAVIMNHQKNVAKGYKDGLDKIKIKIKNIKKKIKKNINNADKVNILRQQLQKYETNLDMKKELKNVSLGTSKTNYIDPRITVAFMKKHNLAIDNLFSKALQTKFNWAFGIGDDFNF
jgi:DNA topoisomerase-1